MVVVEVVVVAVGLGIEVVEVVVSVVGVEGVEVEVQVVFKIWVPLNVLKVLFDK